VSAAVAVACGNNSPPVQPPDPPAGPDAIAIQFTTGGGFTGPCCDPWRMPDITAYGDGRVVLARPGAGQVPDISQATIGRTDLSQLLAGAREAGLLEPQPPDTGPLCCDLAYTDVVVADAVATNEFEVIGLGVEDEVRGELSDGQVRARRAIAELLAKLIGLAEQDPARGGHTSAELAVYVFPTSAVADGEVTAWPLDRSLAEGGSPVARDGRCLHLNDANEVSLVIAAARDSAGPVWSNSGRQWTVFIRPLLPHEHDCP
jgi:hypothetical protein